MIMLAELSSRILPAHTVTLLVVTVCALWRFCFRPYLERRKPHPDIPLACGSHWYWGHQQQVAVVKRNQNNNNNNIQEIQEILALDSANNYGRTGFWLRKARYIALSHWEDVRTIMLLPADSFDNRPVHGGEQITKPHCVPLKNASKINLSQAEQLRSHTGRTLGSFDLLTRVREATLDTTAIICHTLEREIMKLQEENDNSQDPLLRTCQCDILLLAKHICLDIFGRSMFSRSFDCCDNLENSEYVRALEDISEGKPTGFLNFKHRRKYSDTLQKMRRAIETKIKDQENDATFNGQSKNKPDKQYQQKSSNALLDQLLGAANNHSTSRDKKATNQLVDLLMTMMLPTVNTVSSIIANALNRVSQDASVEQNCMHEIFSSQDIQSTEELSYCKAVILETLRICPPQVAVTKRLKKAVTLRGNLVVPAGTSLYIPIWSLHHSARSFPRPNEFRPDRWVKKSSQGWTDRAFTDCSTDIPAANRQAFFAFGAGDNACPAQNLSIEQTTLMFVGLLKRFKFDSVIKSEEISTSCQDLLLEGSMPLQISVRDCGNKKLDN